MIEIEARLVELESKASVVKLPKETSEPEEEIINTKNGDSFFMILAANPTTGYQWELDFNSSYVQLIDKKYIPSSPELIGSGGQETFNFLALKSGETDITFFYLRPWEKDKPPIEEKVYEIIIK